MSGNKELQDVQALTEIRRDRGFNDGSIRLGHEAAHTGQLPDLRSRTTGTGVSHHEDGVEGSLTDLVPILIGRRFGTQFVHHGARHLIIGTRPNVDHFVVALTIGDQTRGVLFLDFLHLALSLLQNLNLFFGHHHIVSTDGDPGHRGVVESGVHQLVSKNNRFL